MAVYTPPVSNTVPLNYGFLNMDAVVTFQNSMGSGSTTEPDTPPEVEDDPLDIPDPTSLYLLVSNTGDVYTSHSATQNYTKATMPTNKISSTPVKKLVQLDDGTLITYGYGYSSGFNTYEFKSVDNGSTWTQTLVATNMTAKDWAIHDGRIVIVGSGSSNMYYTLTRTTSQSTWTENTWTFKENNSNKFAQSVVWSDLTNCFILVGSYGKIYTSTDGTTWSETYSLSSEVGQGSMDCINDVLIIHGLSFTTPTSYTVSTYNHTSNITNNLTKNYVTKTHSPINGEQIHMYSTAYGNGIYVTAGYNSYYATSTDGVNWSDYAKLPAVAETGYSGNIFNISFIDGLFMTVLNNHLVTSSDGVAWKVSNKTICPDSPIGVNYTNILKITI